jgi:excisionase family DNA binding protein
VDQVNADAKQALIEKELPLAMSVKEASKLIGVSAGRLYEGVRRGNIPSLRMGSRILTPTHKLMEMLGNESQ